MSNLIIVDDHGMFVDGMKSLLTTTDFFDTISTASTVQQAMETIEKGGVDLAIVDIEITGSDINGIEFTKLLKKSYPQIKVMIVSMYKTAQVLDQIMEAGADGYLAKDCRATDLKQALKSLLSGGEFWDQSIFQIMIEQKKKDALSRTTKVAPQMSMTDREMDVLKLLAQGYSSKQIGQELNIGTSTVDTHRKNMIAKFDAKNTMEVASMAKDLGMI